MDDWEVRWRVEAQYDVRIEFIAKTKERAVDVAQGFQKAGWKVRLHPIKPNHPLASWNPDENVGAPEALLYWERVRDFLAEVVRISDDEALLTVWNDQGNEHVATQVVKLLDPQAAVLPTGPDIQSWNDRIWHIVSREEP